jgi:DNA-binding GntR family transcriptional regulator
MAVRDRRRGAAEVADLSALAPVPTTWERVTEVIREGIFEGRFRPGTPLPENRLAQALHVSRNSVREALRMLSNEHLVTYEPNKGVAVRSLREGDVRDIYTARRLLELSALDALAAGERTLPRGAFAATLAASDEAAAAGDWRAVGTANLRFHGEIVALHRSDRFDEFFRRLATELRLGFLELADPERFHAPYLARNHRLARLLHDGDAGPAHAELDAYLRQAAEQVAVAVGAARAGA